MDPSAALDLARAGGVGVAVLCALMVKDLLTRAIDAWGKRGRREGTPPHGILPVDARLLDAIDKLQAGISGNFRVLTEIVGANEARHKSWRQASDLMHEQITDLLATVHRLEVEQARSRK